MKKIVSAILSLVMTLSLCSPAFAVEYRAKKEIGIGIETKAETDIELAKDAYTSLSPEAKAIFDATLVSDPELLAFHKNHVDPNCDIEVPPIVVHRAVAAADPMQILSAELNRLALPTAVMYSLMAMGAGMVAATADGPLLFGDILLAAATASAVIVLAAHWNKVSPRWNSIVYAFRKAFAASASNLISAFQTLQGDAQAAYKNKFNSSAQDAVNNIDANKQNHILNNNLHKNGHSWKKLFNGKNPKWNQLAPVLLKVLKEGSEHPYNGSTTVFEREFYYKGITIVVRFVKDAEGFVKWLSTAYLR